MRFIHILFDDTTRQDGWIALDGWKPPATKCHACGLVQHEDNRTITIVSMLSDEEMMTPLTIPKSAIIEQWDLEAK